MQLPGKATQKVFDEALVILARDAPPVPGFRKSKGGTNASHGLCLNLVLVYVCTQFFLHETCTLVFVCLK